LPFDAKSAMVEILVSDQCERRPPLLTGGRFDSDQCDGTCIPAPAGLFPLFCALFFPLFAIVAAPAAFLSPAQGLAL
jgi:hypothetical protein